LKSNSDGLPEIQYRPDRENTLADALSRKGMFTAITILKFDDLEDWVQEVLQDSKLQDIIQALFVNPESHKGYQLQGDRLYYEGN